MSGNKKIVVTRHRALVEYLREEGMVDDNVPVVDHASPDDVRGKHVFGVVPTLLALHADRVTEVPISVPRELRGKELSLEDVRKYAQSPITYKVVRLDG